MQGVRTAKLPIKENFNLAATHVLTINHVYEILLKYNELKSWTDAITAVLPKRKEAKVKPGDQEESVSNDGTVNSNEDCQEPEVSVETQEA